MKILSAVSGFFASYVPNDPLERKLTVIALKVSALLPAVLLLAPQRVNDLLAHFPRLLHLLMPIS